MENLLSEFVAFSIIGIIIFIIKLGLSTTNNDSNNKNNNKKERSNDLINDYEKEIYNTLRKTKKKYSKKELSTIISTKLENNNTYSENWQIYYAKERILNKLFSND